MRGTEQVKTDLMMGEVVLLGSCVAVIVAFLIAVVAALTSAVPTP